MVTDTQEHSLKTFIQSPSRNHLIFSNGCIDGLVYVDVGLEISTYIEDKVGDRRLSMRTQDIINIKLKDSIRTSETFGSYLAITNIGIIFEPALKIDIEGLLNRWSQNVCLFVNIEKGIIDNNSLFLVKGCPIDYSVSLEAINYYEFNKTT